MVMLNLIQERARIRSELSRRIGYTNGLHDIFRFARVVRYMFELGPASSVMLRNAILANEQVTGTKYADGVIEVSGALGLIHKTGTKLTLGDKGFALHALEHLGEKSDAQTALLLNAILEADGDATLNLLDLVSRPNVELTLGEALVNRLIDISEFRTEWAELNISNSIAREMILSDLRDVKRRLEHATDPDRKRSQTWASYNEERRLSSQQKINRFYEHTVNPRRGWLRDLGCIRSEGNKQFTITERGRQLLGAFQEMNCYLNSMFILPMSTDITRTLGLPNTDEDSNIFWRAVASYFEDDVRPTNLNNVAFFNRIKALYPRLKLHVFDEATVESIYDANSALLAAEGEFVSRIEFERIVEALSHEFSDQFFRLRGRQGGGGYITLRDRPIQF